VIAATIFVLYNNNNNNKNNNNKDLTIEIQRTWNVKTKVIPVIIGATGTISKSLRKYVKNNRKSRS
jgi:RNase P/RNase MRP subunit POP5